MGTHKVSISWQASGDGRYMTNNVTLKITQAKHTSTGYAGGGSSLRPNTTYATPVSATTALTLPPPSPAAVVSFSPESSPVVKDKALLAIVEAGD